VRTGITAFPPGRRADGANSGRRFARALWFWVGGPILYVFPLPATILLLFLIAFVVVQERRATEQALDSLDFKFVENLRPPCSRCCRPLILTKVETDEPGFDLRTYYCAACEDTEDIVSAI
jgi:hypothetical protein